jgi:hypothetical protein
MMNISNAVKVGILKKAVITAAVLTCVPSSAFADLNSIMAQANSTYSSAMAQGATSAVKDSTGKWLASAPVATAPATQQTNTYVTNTYPVSGGCTFGGGYWGAANQAQVDQCDMSGYCWKETITCN